MSVQQLRDVLSRSPPGPQRRAIEPTITALAQNNGKTALRAAQKVRRCNALSR